MLDGGSWFPPMAAERSEADAELAAASRSSRLSSSACCCAWPMAPLNKQIAAELGAGRKHRQGACHRHLEKTGCYSRTRAAVLVKAWRLAAVILSPA